MVILEIVLSVVVFHLFLSVLQIEGKWLVLMD